MLQLRLAEKTGKLEILCLGAHGDDIEIGCAGTLLTLVERGYRLRLTWVVLCAEGDRATESTRSAQALFGAQTDLNLELSAFKDSHFPAEFAGLKARLQEIRRGCNPDLVFTHCLDDRHQDHRLVAELTWQTWRDHLVFEYEVPKYEGDLGRPNVYFPLQRDAAHRKVDHLLHHFGTQRSKDWFTADTFHSLMRLRGIECRAPDGLAEGFLARKMVF